MRVFPRLALVVLLLGVFAAPAVLADHFQADCPLTLVATNAPASTFTLSPSGAFRSGSQVFVLRGQTLTTFTTTDLGDMQIARWFRRAGVRTPTSCSYKNSKIG